MRSSLNLATPRGANIRFHGEGGYPHENARSRSILVVGQVYTLAHLEVGDWSSDVYLTEFPGHSFNSVLFENADDSAPAAEPALRHPEPDLRELILTRIAAFRKDPYNGEHAFEPTSKTRTKAEIWGSGKIPASTKLGTLSDQELLDAFVRVVRYAYRQR